MASINVTVTAPCVMIANEETGQFSHFYEGATIPAGYNDERVAQLVEEKMVRKADPSPKSESDSTKAKAPSVDEILAEVGDDKDKAAAALAAEQGVAKPRKSLVEKLEAVIAGPAT